MASSGFAIWTVYACALLLFVATANCTVTYYSIAYNTEPALFDATLDDNDLKGVCTLSGATWAGPDASQELACTNGYSATAVFGPADDYGVMSQTVTVSRPGFNDELGTNGCFYYCDCGKPSCVTWTGQAW